jgi:hypothetical protein
MRACFLGQNVTALGFGVAMLQTQPQAAEPPLENQWRSHPEPEPQQKADAATEKAPKPPEPAPAQPPQAA